MGVNESTAYRIIPNEDTLIASRALVCREKEETETGGGRSNVVGHDGNVERLKRFCRGKKQHTLKSQVIVEQADWRNCAYSARRWQ